MPDLWPSGFHRQLNLRLWKLITALYVGSDRIAEHWSSIQRWADQLPRSPETEPFGKAGRVQYVGPFASGIIDCALLTQPHSL